jgi:hypothetical protein
VPVKEKGYIVMSAVEGVLAILVLSYALGLSNIISRTKVTETMFNLFG